jgi:hypothetical protein
MARAASLPCPLRLLGGFPFEAKVRKRRSRPRGRRAVHERRVEIAEQLDAITASQAHSLPAMEPEKLADPLHDLADPTRLAIVHGIRHAGQLSPRGSADDHCVAPRPRWPTRPHRARPDRAAPQRCTVELGADRLGQRALAHGAGLQLAAVQARRGCR